MTTGFSLKAGSFGTACATCCYLGRSAAASCSSFCASSIRQDELIAADSLQAYRRASAKTLRFCAPRAHITHPQAWLCLHFSRLLLAPATSCCEIHNVAKSNLKGAVNALGRARFGHHLKIEHGRLQARLGMRSEEVTCTWYTTPSVSASREHNHATKREIFV